MHTLFEGFITYVLGLVMAALIQEKYFTIDELNSEISKLVSFLRAEKKNKPCDIILSILLQVEYTSVKCQLLNCGHFHDSFQQL